MIEVCFVHPDTRTHTHHTQHTQHTHTSHTHNIHTHHTHHTHNTQHTHTTHTHTVTVTVTDSNLLFSQMMFEQYNFKGVYIAIQAVLTLYAQGEQFQHAHIQVVQPASPPSY